MGNEQFFTAKAIAFITEAYADVHSYTAIKWWKTETSV